MAELRKVEAGHSTSVSVDSRSQTISGVKFPMSVAAVSALSKFVDSSETNYVQFYIGITSIIFSRFFNVKWLIIKFFVLDIAKESVELAISDFISVENLNEKVPKNDARYHLYKYQHKKNGTQTMSVCE